MNERFVLAVDGGGTSTEVALASVDADGRPHVVGRASGGPANVTTVGSDAAVRVLTELVLQAAAAFETTPTIELGMVALAGVGDVPTQRRLEAQLVDSRLASTIHVMSDVELVLSLAECSSPEEHATIGLVAGTGSVAFARRPDDDTSPLRAGGWGSVLGDEGGGFWLGRAAIRHALAALDRSSPRSGLTAAILAECNAESSTALIRWAHAEGQVSRRVAELAPLVVKVAEGGDVAARRFVEQAANHLCELLIILSQRLDIPPELTSVACGGSLVTKVTAIRNHFESFSQQSGFAAVYFVEDPVLAAIQLAASAVSD